MIVFLLQLKLHSSSYNFLHFFKVCSASCSEEWLPAQIIDADQDGPPTQGSLGPGAHWGPLGPKRGSQSPSLLISAVRLVAAKLQGSKSTALDLKKL